MKFDKNSVCDRVKIIQIKINTGMQTFNPQSYYTRFRFERHISQKHRAEKKFNEVLETIQHMLRIFISAQLNL